MRMQFDSTLKNSPSRAATPHRSERNQMTDVSIGDGLEPVVASEPSLRRMMGPC
jgi:hypothetical protein